MTECKECGVEYEVGTKEFCSQKCLEKNIQNRVIDATEKDQSHTSKFSKKES
ncbi:hypothetical protein BD31_I1869 [Candidatus Nitrosopumilus salaria BD31]|uniref:Uncharacterized protein n=1 Tax=Candidatus Nitrosopumilus salarius BD31 TaxID=859350 RepID=I3D446_9ARCH|nr:hypothetical protein [Candidatus Nitrosopumilus salaria]EIJ66489.1 hypothetical protein BD31_I1869 [Candidatus Nitrosopumilus salaria BD31]